MAEDRPTLASDCGHPVNIKAFEDKLTYVVDKICKAI